MILIRINCPDPETARAIAAAAVEKHLAACANIEPPIRSVYRWQGAVEEGEETPLILKTRAALFDEVAALARGMHPDETPAILAIPVERSTPDFAAWLEAETGGG